MWNQLTFVPQSSLRNGVRSVSHVLCILGFCSCHDYFYLILSHLGHSDFKFFKAGLFFFWDVYILLEDLHIHTDYTICMKNNYWTRTVWGNLLFLTLQAFSLTLIKTFFWATWSWMKQNSLRKRHYIRAPFISVPLLPYPLPRKFRNLRWHKVDKRQGKQWKPISSSEPDSIWLGPWSWDHFRIEKMDIPEFSYTAANLGLRKRLCM